MTSAQASSGRIPKLDRRPWEILFQAGAVLSLLASCILWSSKKQQWVDEIYTRTEVSDPCLTHLFHALQRMGTGEMPLFYLTAWPWARLFGNGDLSLRLYSSVAMCGSMIVLWRMLRQCWPAKPVAFGVLSVWCGSSLVLGQNSEARGYGLYLLLAALAVWAYLRVAQSETPDRLSLCLLAVSQGALLLSHVLALIFGVLMLLALILFDAGNRRFRPIVYLCHVSGWLALLLWLPAIQSSMATGNPRGWILLPTLLDLFVAYGFGMFSALLSPTFALSSALGGILSLIIFLVIFVVAANELFAFARNEDASKERRALLLLSFLLLAAPLVFFVISYTGKPIFQDRYMLPSLIGLAILLTSFVERRLTDKNHVLLGWFVVLLAMPLMLAAEVRPGGLDARHVEAAASNNLPIVAGWQHDFFVLLRYSDHPERYAYLLDWDIAKGGNSTAVPDFHLMHSYRDQGYYVSNIHDQSEFLCAHADFLVLENSDWAWFDLAIPPLPHFAWKDVAKIDATHRLIAVHRSGSLPFCGAAGNASEIRLP
jgi:hypothetical protein